MSVLELLGTWSGRFLSPAMADEGSCCLLWYLGASRQAAFAIQSHVGWLSGGHAGQRSLFFDRWAVMHLLVSFGSFCWRSWMATVDVCTGRLFRRVFERMPARHGCKCRRLLMSAKADTPVQILLRTSFFSSFVHPFPRVSSGVGFLLVSSLADSPGFQAGHRPWMFPTFFLIPSHVPEGVVLR